VIEALQGPENMKKTLTFEALLIIFLLLNACD
jgi:hypothetical protein